MASCLRHAMDKTTEDAAWQVWVSMYPFMSQDSFVSFSEFKEEAIQKADETEYTDISTEDILEEMTKIAKAHKSKT